VNNHRGDQAWAEYPLSTFHAVLHFCPDWILTPRLDLRADKSDVASEFYPFVRQLNLHGDRPSAHIARIVLGCVQEAFNTHRIEVEDA
jgi:hypothetical protein